MKLRRWFLPHQYLFAAAAVALLSCPLHAQHQVVTKDGKTREVEVMGVSGSNIQVKVGAGTLGLPLATVERVRMDAPPGYETAVAAVRAGNWAKALAETRPLVEKYRGLPVDWARQASSLLGDIHVQLGQYEDAEKAYQAYQAAYPGQGSLPSDVGRARIAVARKNFEEAGKLLAPVVEQALRGGTPAPEQALAYSQAFYLLGEVKAAAGDFGGALEDYLRTVTIFHQDQTAVENARQQADALRKEHPGVVVP